MSQEQPLASALSISSESTGTVGSGAMLKGQRAFACF